MTYNDFYNLFESALNENYKDVFVSKWPDVPAKALDNIWDIAHMDIAALRKETGLTQVQFAIRFCIPRRTVENWELRKGSCAPYIRLMIAKEIGLLHVKITP